MKTQPPFLQVQKPTADLDNPNQSKLTDHLITNLSQVQVIDKINDSRFPVFLVKSPSNEFLVLKIFQYHEEKVNQSYVNESRFCNLSHENCISFITSFDKQKCTSGVKKFYSSCILMELAPYGDFSEFLMKHEIYHDEVLIRTYFHQLVAGIEYLHSNRIAHMDIKLENLLLGANYKLKIGDFDLTFVKGDTRIRGKGTRNYRAPELKNKECSDPFAVDLYSLGIVLFIFKTGGFPAAEETLIEGYNLLEMILSNDNSFWDTYEKIQHRKVEFSDDFKNLFFSLVKRNPSERMSISEIKKNKWFTGPTYTDWRLTMIMSKYGLKSYHLKY
jgi:serine/threonine protein kinase